MLSSRRFASPRSARRNQLQELLDAGDEPRAVCKRMIVIPFDFPEQLGLVRRGAVSLSNL
jgi:hypothetical protein